MRVHDEYEVLNKHPNMFDTDLRKNILVPLENATPEVCDAIESLNNKMNKGNKK